MKRLKHLMLRLAKLRRRPPAEAHLLMRGYNICVNGYPWRWEPTWKAAFKRASSLQRRLKGTGMVVEMRRLRAA